MLYLSLFITDIVINLEPSSQTLSEGSNATFRITAVGLSDLPYSVTFLTIDGNAVGMCIEITTNVYEYTLIQLILLKQHLGIMVLLL